MENGETSSAPSTPTASIAAAMSSPVTSSGPARDPLHGRSGRLRSYACTCESIMGIRFAIVYLLAIHAWVV